MTSLVQGPSFTHEKITKDCEKVVELSYEMEKINKQIHKVTKEKDEVSKEKNEVNKEINDITNRINTRKEKIEKIEENKKVILTKIKEEALIIKEEAQKQIKESKETLKEQEVKKVKILKEQTLCSSALCDSLFIKENNKLISVTPPKGEEEIKKFCKTYLPKSDIIRKKVNNEIGYLLQTFVPIIEYTKNHTKVSTVDLSNFVGEFPDPTPFVEYLKTAYTITTVIIPPNLPEKFGKLFNDVKEIRTGSLTINVAK